MLKKLITLSVALCMALSLVQMSCTESGESTSLVNIIQGKSETHANVTGLTLNYETVTLFTGNELALMASVSPSNATNKNVTWSSSDTSKAEVASNGKVTAKAVGSAVITATTVDGGFKDTCQVEVLDRAQNISREINVSDKNYFFGISPGGLNEAEWQMYKEMGLKTIRVHLQRGRYWINGAYDFSAYDEICLRAAKEGIEVMMLVSYETYESNGILTSGQYVYDDYMKLVDVLEVAIPHFKNKGVTAWEIWNEENSYWKVDAAGYADLISTIYKKCKYGTNPWDIKANIILGGMDAMNSGFQDGVRQDCKQYLTDIYASQSYIDFYTLYHKSPFDAIGLHNYMTIDVNNHLELDYNKFLSSLQGVVFDVTDINGDTGMPVWITEVGDPDALDELQAAKLRSYMEVAYAIPRVARFHWFEHTFPASNYTTNGRSAMTEYKEVIAELTDNAKAAAISIKLNKNTIGLPLYSTFQLKATITPFDTADKTITWTSSDADIANVENGFITALKSGVSVITAKTNDGSFTDTCEVTVYASAAVNFKPGTYGEYMHLISANCSPYLQPSIDFRFADGYLTFTYQLNLDTTAAKSTLYTTVFQQYKVWLSKDNSNWTVVAEETNAANKGKGNKKIVTADLADYLAGGVVYVKIGDSFPNNGWGGAMTNLSVVNQYANPVSTITLDKTVIAVDEGAIIRLNPTITPEDATNKGIVWISNSACASVTQDGTVKGVTPGIAIITETTADGSKTATCEVTVNAGASSPQNIVLGKPVYSPFAVNSGASAEKLIDGKISADEKWCPSVFGIDGQNVFVMIKLGDAPMTADGFRLYFASMFEAEHMSIRSFKIYSSNDDSMWETATATDLSNTTAFKLVYDSMLSTIPLFGEGLTQYAEVPVWPLPQDITYDSGRAFFPQVKEMFTNGEDFKTIEPFQQAFSGKYLIFEVTGNMDNNPRVPELMVFSSSIVEPVESGDSSNVASDATESGSFTSEDNSSLTGGDKSDSVSDSSEENTANPSTGETSGFVFILLVMVFMSLGITFVKKRKARNGGK